MKLALGDFARSLDKKRLHGAKVSNDVTRIMLQRPICFGDLPDFQKCYQTDYQFSFPVKRSN